MKASIGAVISSAVLVGTTLSLSPEIFAATTGANVSQASNAPAFLSAKTYTPKQLGEIVTPPPDHFNPLTASNEALKKYGFPLRPTNSSQLKEWTYLMEHYKKFVVPKIKIGRGENPLNVSTAGTSTNWSGYMDSGHTFKKVNGTWTIPTLADNVNQDAGTAYSVAWVGMGGSTKKNPLIQAGSEQDMTVTIGSHGIRQYSPYYGLWWEVVPLNYMQYITNLSIDPNDQLYVHISYNTSNSGTFRWYMENITTGYTTSGQKTGISSYYDGSTAEWITERPTENNALPSLADFGSIPFTNDTAVTSAGTSYYIGQATHESLTMIDSTTGDTLANPSGLSSDGSFTDHWDNFN